MRHGGYAVALALVAVLSAAESGAQESALELDLAETRRQLRQLEERIEAEQQSMRRHVEELERQLKEQALVIERLQGGEAGAKEDAQATPGASGKPPLGTEATREPSGAPPATLATAAAEGGVWSPADPIRLFGSSRAYVNLSFDTLVDAGWSTTSEVTDLQLGDHDPIQRGFTVPNAELVLDGAVDPYFTGLADVVFKLDEDNETEVELEEVYLTTTALPWNLQVRGGQFFTEFGRHNQQHPHQWDFVDVPLVLGRILGPEGLRNPGARVSWLTPTPFYSEALLTVMDSQGGTAASFRDEGTTRFGREPVGTAVRSPGDLLFVPRYVASFDLTSAQTLVAGLSGAFGPNATGPDTDTRIYGLNVYWKWKPEWQSAGWPFASFQAEGLYRRFEAASAIVATETDVEPPLVLPRESLHDYGFYAQALYGFRRRWVAGLRSEYVTGGSGAFSRDPDRSDRFRLAPNLTFYPTEFSKLRLQCNYDHGQIRGDDHALWLQAEFLLGAHGAHKF